MHHGLGQGVHGPERLVEQEHAGVVHHGPGDFHAAAHTRGNFARVVVLDAHEAHLAEHLHGLVLRLFLAHGLLDDGPEGDVLKHGEPREQRAVLEDHDAVGTGLRLLVGGAEHFAVEEDFAAADAVEARDGVQERRLAASRRADHHAELAGGDVHGAAVHGKDLGAVGVVYLADAVDLDVPARGRFVAAHRTSSLTFHCMRRLPIIRMSKLLNEPMTPSVIMAMMITGYCTSMNEFQMR